MSSRWKSYTSKIYTAHCKLAIVLPLTKMVCIVGWSGVHCDRDVDECAGTPCRNGATCLDGQNSYVCRCLVGYTGRQCETDVDECATAPCENGGTCSNHVGHFSCTCMRGFTGGYSLVLRYWSIVVWCFISLINLASTTETVVENWSVTMKQNVSGPKSVQCVTLSQLISSQVLKIKIWSLFPGQLPHYSGRFQVYQGYIYFITQWAHVSALV